MKVVETLNDFLKVTTFPYTPSSVEMLGMGTEKGAPFGPPSGGSAPGGGTQQESTTYDTVEDYIAYFNEASQWVTYDSASNTATITGLEGFVTSRKNASKDVGAFDGVDRYKTENIVLGDGENGLHFSSLSREVIAAGQDAYSSLSGWSQDCGVTAYEKDLATVDSVGTDMSIRIDMYDPLYYLTQGSRGRGTFTVAPAWRIRTGIHRATPPPRWRSTSHSPWNGPAWTASTSQPSGIRGIHWPS